MSTSLQPALTLVFGLLWLAYNSSGEQNVCDNRICGHGAFCDGNNQCRCKEGFMEVNKTTLNIFYCLEICQDACPLGYRCINKRCQCAPRYSRSRTDARCMCGTAVCGPGSECKMNDCKCKADFENKMLLNKEDKVVAYCQASCNKTDPCPFGLICNAGRCQCAEGFEISSNGYCEDTDECSLNPPKCVENAICTNTIGSFKCACQRGWAMVENRCTDINECNGSEPICGEEQVCFNTPGSYICFNRSMCGQRLFDETPQPQSTALPLGLGIGLSTFFVVVILLVVALIYKLRQKKTQNSESAVDGQRIENHAESGQLQDHSYAAMPSPPETSQVSSFKGSSNQQIADDNGTSGRSDKHSGVPGEKTPATDNHTEDKGVSNTAFSNTYDYLSNLNGETIYEELAEPNVKSLKVNRPKSDDGDNNLKINSVDYSKSNGYLILESDTVDFLPDHSNAIDKANSEDGEDDYPQTTGYHVLETGDVNSTGNDTSEQETNN